MNGTFAVAHKGSLPTSSCIFVASCHVSGRLGEIIIVNSLPFVLKVDRFQGLIGLITLVGLIL